MTGAGPARRAAESGQASLEKIGGALIAGVVIVAVALTVNTGSVGATVSQAWCAITSLGQGDCSGDGSQLANPKVPTEPCVVGEDGHRASMKAAFVVSGKNERALVVEELSDGTYRVAMVDGGQLGVEGGVGWDARLEVNGTRWGSDLYAGGGAYLDAAESQVWTVRSEDELAALVDYARFADTVDSTTGPLSGPITWIGEQTGFVDKPREPDSVVYSGGLSASGSAGITAWVGGGELEAAVGADGAVEVHADGRRTYYVGASGTLDLSGAISIEAGSLGGTASTRMVVETDADGETTAVRFETNVVTDGERSVYTDTVSLDSDADRQLFEDYLAEAATTAVAGPGGLLLDRPATEDFAAMIDERGQQTRLTYDTGDSLDISANASGKLLGEVGLEGAFSLPSAALTDAEYDDGTGWVPWAGCMGAG
ncbi:hypothetical protein KC207_05005 [Phycicoccus sp. BSK3Z-2]|uniref:Uncharacterized protein n=1 Tax=Phycicoccus avicenniae TaxID=2828860 RepID=A0A941D691_9MICO|nr:hypothetical protein [Phycicoccus avicenniae]MBR7742645.1 hypothetical protein [Phycicoccus avicenniae]